MRDARPAAGGQEADRRVVRWLPRESGCPPPARTGRASTGMEARPRSAAAVSTDGTLDRVLAELIADAGAGPPTSRAGSVTVW